MDEGEQMHQDQEEQIVRTQSAPKVDRTLKTIPPGTKIEYFNVWPPLNRILIRHQKLS